MLLKNVGLKGKHKIADKSQQEPFAVLERPNPDIPVYRIKRGAGQSGSPESSIPGYTPF